MKAGWEVRRLGEVCEFRRGLTYAKGDEVDSGGTAVLRAMNIDLETGELDLNDIRYIAPAVDVPKSKMVEAGTLLICTASGSKKHLGKAALIDQPMNFAFGGFMGLLVPSATLLPKYLHWIMRSDAYWEFIDQLSSGTNINNLKFSQLSAFPIPLPPLEEQQRIVAVLDEAFEGLTRARAHAEANLQDARELFDSAIGHIFSRASDWPCPKIAEIGRVFDGPHATPKTVDKGPLFLGISSLVDGRIELAKTRHVTEEDFARWTKRVTPRGGDVVFSYETRLGQVGLIPDGMKCCLGRRMGLIRLNREVIDPEYFVLCYLSPDFQKFLREKTIKGATVDRLSIKDFPDFGFPTPALEVQEVIVDQVRTLRVQLDFLVERAETKLQSLDALRQSLLQKAFAGELT
ncbi:MAG: hypothetical protein C0427_02480 [Rhodobacter sp.]|nr:hypothetical protein [Rhodobacter sp.]